MRLSLFLGVVTSCTPLPIVERDTCGNKVLEPPELCDTFSEPGTTCGPPETDGACRFVCDGGGTCPRGWGCGIDGLCREPAGRFSANPEVYPFRAALLTIADMDGDGFEDVVGNDRSLVHVRYQTEPGRFDGEYLQDTRLPLGRPFIGRASEDRLGDVIMPTPIGLLVMLGQADRTLLSRPYENVAVGTTNDIATIRLLAIGGRERTTREDDLVLVVGHGIGLVDRGATPLPAWLDETRIPEEIEVLETGEDRNIFALWDDGREIGLFTVTGDRQTARVEQLPVSLVAPAPIDSGVHLADANGDGAIDVIAGVAMPGRPIAVAFGSTSTAGPLFLPFCSLSFAITDMEGRPIPVDAPLLEVADFDGDSFADYVFDVITLASAGTPPVCDDPMYYPPIASAIPDRWIDADLGDFNGDGRADLATYTEDRRLDILLGSGTGGFARRTVLLDQPPSKMTVGDFDGDFSDDVSFAVDVDGDDLLHIVFGDAGGDFGEAKPVGRFGDLIDANSLQWAVDLESLDRVGDLLMLSRPAAGETTYSFAIAYGSASRQMFAPLIVEDDAPTFAALMAHVCNCEGPGCTDVPDLFAVTRDVLRPQAGAFVAPGLGGEPPGGFGAPRSLNLPPRISLEFGIGCALWIAADTDRDGKDEVFGVDNPLPPCGTFSTGTASKLFFADPPAAPACAEGATFEIRDIASGGFTGATSIRAADLDADEDLDLAIAFGGMNGSGHGLVLLWNDPSIGSRTSIVDSPPGTTIIDVAPLQLDTDPALELAIRTVGATLPDGAVYFADLEGGEYGEPEAHRSLAIAPGSIGAADLDRDGLEDVVVADGARLYVFRALEVAR
jgi:hypothetical protein